MGKVILIVVLVAAVGVGAYFVVTSTHNEAPKEPSDLVMAGFPADLAAGDSRYVEAADIYIVNDGEGYFAVSAICTHMGCKVDAKEGEEGFVCDCHGSEFDGEGRVEKAPANKSLEHYAISYDEEVGILVDKEDATSEEAKWKDSHYYLSLADVNQ